MRLASDGYIIKLPLLISELRMLGWQRDRCSYAANPSATSGNRYQILRQPEAFSRRVAWWDYKYAHCSSNNIALADNHPVPCISLLTRSPPSPAQRHISAVLDERPAVSSCCCQAFAAVIAVGWPDSSRSSSFLHTNPHRCPLSLIRLQSGPDRPRRPTRPSTGA